MAIKKIRRTGGRNVPPFMVKNDPASLWRAMPDRSFVAKASTFAEATVDKSQDVQLMGAYQQASGFRHQVSKNRTECCGLS